MWTTEIQDFEKYLKTLHFRGVTIYKYQGLLSTFLQWQEEHQITTINYPHLLLFIDHLKAQNKSVDRINKHLLIVRHYIDHLVDQGSCSDNPAVGLQIKKQQQSYTPFLPIATLQELLANYQGKHQVLLSLVIHQALSLGNLQHLQALHINAEKAAIYIPRCAKLKARTLQLEATQILPLLQLKKTRKNYLFGPKSLKNLSYQLCLQLKTICSEVKNLQQLRSSVIAHWLKTQDLRTVQYKAGHGNIKSTEKYLTQNLKSLQHSIDTYHPLQ